MKKIRCYLCTAALVFAVAALTACGRYSGDDLRGTSSAAESTAAGDSSAAESTAAGGSSAGTGASGAKNSTGREESTGVLDDLMDDVEQGLHDLEGDSEGPSNNADESDNR